MAQHPALHEWLRSKKKFPHLWCPGCGIGTIMGAATRALSGMDYSKDEVAVISGIGCTGRIPAYLDCNTLHTTHGRALTFATGVKFSKPNLKVLVFMGDGDGLAIGGNHFIHTCRRNIDLTVVLVNNYIYGMTGGQASPTIPEGMKASTAPYGSIEPTFDVCGLAIAAGATFVARSTVYHIKEVEKLIQKGMAHKGFSMIEIVAQCPTSFGRMNKLGNPIDMLNYQKEHSIKYQPGMDIEKAKAEGKDIITGVLKDDNTRMEYCEKYDELVVKKALAGEKEKKK